MGEGLYWETVSDILREVLLKLMKEPLFNSFRLVGGTALSLQAGHRKSEDIDLFTDAPYQSVSFEVIDAYLKKAFTFVSEGSHGPTGMGKRYLVGTENSFVKLDLYYTDSFVFPLIEKDKIRMAATEEIIAMKLDILGRGGRKKDFWDLHELMDKYTISQMIDFHKKRYPFSHERGFLIKGFMDFGKAENEYDPICLKGKHWEIIQKEILQEVLKLQMREPSQIHKKGR